MKNLLRYLFFNLLTVIILLAILEFASRAFLHKIYNRGFDSALIVRHKYIRSDGLKENASGRVWGKEFHTDGFGCRKNARYISGKKKWLFIGDSVTEGVGVEDNETFSSVVADSIDSLNILNYSLIGYSSADYYNVLRSALNRSTDIQKATIFFCLNDVYGAAGADELPVMAQRNWKGRINAALQDRYATYKLVKLIMTKNSDRYFKYDEQFYKEGDPRFSEAMNYLRKCDSVCKVAGVQLNVVILPYRTQVEGRDKKNIIPQQLIGDFCGKNHILCADALPYLDKQARPRDLYLFSDEIHLSPKGHKALAGFILSL